MDARDARGIMSLTYIVKKSAQIRSLKERNLAVKHVGRVLNAHERAPHQRSERRTLRGRHRRRGMALLGALMMMRATKCVLMMRATQCVMM